MTGAEGGGIVILSDLAHGLVSMYARLTTGDLLMTRELRHGSKSDDPVSDWFHPHLPAL
jgi:hypothetical protein